MGEWESGVLEDACARVDVCACVSWFLQAGLRVFSPAKAKIARLVLRGPAMFEPCRAGLSIAKTSPPSHA